MDRQKDSPFSRKHENFKIQPKQLGQILGHSPFLFQVDYILYYIISLRSDGREPLMPTPGVSVITCTNRLSFIHNLFRNYARQRHPIKELIIIVNSTNIPLSPYQKLSRKLPNVRIYRIPGHYSLGACLNFAVAKARHRYISKFDDDDFYASYYLSDNLQTIQRTNADVVGKRAHYMYLRGSKTLILRFPHDEHRSVTRLPGATLFFKRDVSHKVHFPNQSVGEDDLFCIRSKRQGYKVYSAGKYNFVAIRRKNSANHTWVISDKTLIAHHRRIPHVRNYKKYVQRKPQGIRL
jgi:hypothetical protein